MKKIIMALVMAVALVLVAATGVEAANTVSYGTIGTAGATATQIGSDIELYTPAGLTGSGYVRLNIDGGIVLNTITSLSYTAKVITPGAGGFAPEVVLNIDADGADGLEGIGINWMLSSYNPATLSGDNFLSGDNWPPSAGSIDPTFITRDALTGYYYWSANDDRTGFGSFWTPFADVLSTKLSAHGIDTTDMVYSIDFVVGTSGNFDNMRALFSSVELNGTTYSVIPLVRSAEITSPLSGEEVSGMVSFDATLTDKDGDDSVQWAVRKGTCAAATGTVFGNVDGHSDSSDWDGVNFHALADTSSWIPGGYCFVFNPTESVGDAAIRETREFSIKDTIAPLVTIESPSEGDVVSGTVEIYGTVVEDYMLSHYNISVYPGEADFNDFSKRIAQATVYRSTGFTNELIFEWDSTGWDDGEYLIRLAARDSAGNRSYDGDPYLGGDDSQHVIRIITDNAQEAEGRGCYFERQSKPRWNCDKAVLKIFDGEGKIVLDITGIFSGEWEITNNFNWKIIEIYQGINADGKRILVTINHKNGRVTALGGDVWFKGNLVE